MAIAVPRFTGVQDKAQEDADKLTLQMIAKAAELYYVQYDLSGTSEVAISDLDFDDLNLKSEKYDDISNSTKVKLDANGIATEIGDISVDSLD